eukprot:12889440-Prorocentrum_lima.AAC.1
MSRLHFMLLRKAMSEKLCHRDLVLTRKWWMEHYLMVPDLLRKDNRHQSIQGSNQGGNNSTSEP